MTQSHTPHSWEIRKSSPALDGGPTHYLTAPGGHIVAYMFVGGRVVAANKDGSQSNVSVSAAPELLQALEGVVAVYVETYGDEGDDAPDTVKAALAAIAKARGQ